MGGKAIRGVTDSLLENLVRTLPVCVALLLLYAVKIDELLKMAHSDASPQVRGQAIFWLAQKAGKKAGASIAAAIENDPDMQVKKRAVFALSQLPQDEGVPQLMHVADNNSNPAIRKEAIFWLGQSKDPRALEYLEAILKR
jgi:HEAT repeat protein